MLDIMFAYNALMLLFGTAHCCSLLCGGCMPSLQQYACLDMLMGCGTGRC